MKLGVILFRAFVVRKNDLVTDVVSLTVQAEQPLYIFWIVLEEVRGIVVFHSKGDSEISLFEVESLVLFDIFGI